MPMLLLWTHTGVGNAYVITVHRLYQYLLYINSLNSEGCLSAGTCLRLDINY